MEETAIRGPSRSSAGGPGIGSSLYYKWMKGSNPSDASIQIISATLELDEYFRGLLRDAAKSGPIVVDHGQMLNRRKFLLHGSASLGATVLPYDFGSASLLDELSMMILADPLPYTVARSFLGKASIPAHLGDKDAALVASIVSCLCARVEIDQGDAKAATASIATAYVWAKEAGHTWAMSWACGFQSLVQQCAGLPHAGILVGIQGADLMKDARGTAATQALAMAACASAAAGDAQQTLELVEQSR